MAKKKSSKKSGSWKKPLAIVVVILMCLGGASAWEMYSIIYGSNVGLSTDKVYFYIPTGSKFQDVSNALVEQGFIESQATFDWVSEQKKYKLNVRAGCYRLKNGMSNNELVNMLRAGLQEPVMVTFNNVRFKEDLAGKVGKFIEADSTQIINLLNSNSFVSKYGFNTTTFLTIFLPNTYEFWWNTSAEQFLERMTSEYKKFWTAERKQKAKNLGLSQSEVSILASIVQKETNKNDEKPTVAGVYLNRLRKGMLLQADPTLVYANRDFEARRVLNSHKAIDSPYNTYKYKGLPPGPICLPSIESIDAVLNAKSHSYLYFCAKADNSGYHSFATTYSQHLQNAREFQRELNRRKVYR
ncbi:MAG: endolytic transglycosylase MltG [Flavobacteriales bacterium]|nr:endolytic transglycosylase MltG [Flavobacteriales bacterium]